MLITSFEVSPPNLKIPTMSTRPYVPAKLVQAMDKNAMSKDKFSEQEIISNVLSNLSDDVKDTIFKKPILQISRNLNKENIKHECVLTSGFEMLNLDDIISKMFHGTDFSVQFVISELTSENIEKAEIIAKNALSEQKCILDRLFFGIPAGPSRLAAPPCQELKSALIQNLPTSVSSFIFNPYNYKKITVNDIEGKNEQSKVVVSNGKRCPISVHKRDLHCVDGGKDVAKVDTTFFGLKFSTASEQPDGSYKKKTISLMNILVPKSQADTMHQILTNEISEMEKLDLTEDVSIFLPSPNTMLDILVFTQKRHAFSTNEDFQKSLEVKIRALQELIDEDSA